MCGSQKTHPRNRAENVFPRPPKKILLKIKVVLPHFSGFKQCQLLHALGFRWVFWSRGRTEVVLEAQGSEDRIRRVPGFGFRLRTFIERQPCAVAVLDANPRQGQGQLLLSKSGQLRRTATACSPACSKSRGNFAWYGGSESIASEMGLVPQVRR